MQTRIGSNTKELRYIQADGCEAYDPCPICYKCMNKAAHLYARCASCPVEHDAHTHKNRSWLIRRENFALKLTDETKKALE
jgi:hypothetical protein